MSWYYPETRPQRLPLTTPVRPATTGGTGGPPTGPAGGDLTGTYPAPTLAPGAVGTTDVVDGAITDAKITSVAYAKVTGAPAIPTTLPPTGPAGGDLSGTYPNPTVRAGLTVPIPISATAPVAPVVGELWWRSTDGNLYLYYNDGTSTQWVPAMASVGMLTAPPVAGGGALVVSDSFESYVLGLITAPWTTVSNTRVANAQAHGGVQSLAIGSGGNASTGALALGTSLTKWKLDVWMYVNSVGGTTQYIGLQKGSSAGLIINVPASGAGTVLQATGATFFTFTALPNVWQHYVLTVFQHATAGTVNLTLDGASVGTFSGDTRDMAGNTAVDFFYATGTTIGPSPPAELYIDDLAVYNTA